MGEFEADQRHITMLYELLEHERVKLVNSRDSALARPAESPEERRDRDSRIHYTGDRISELNAADSGLCFGRMDSANARTYLGRLGLFDQDGEEQLLLDWRAPAARAFYCATPNQPMELTRRRHFRCHRDQIRAVNEEFLDSAHTIDQSLLSSLESARTERMRDIVSTIQADQDAIIREPSSGILVIEGGPGTGKTAVALHRIAYLLYTERALLERRGVLMLGPNERFLDYIGQVLPSLGETGVVFHTPGELYPGVHARATESLATHRIKGEPEMVDVLRSAVADRQELPSEPIPIELDDVTIELTADICAPARDRARASGSRHNPARAVFAEHVLDSLAELAAHAIGADLLEPADVRELRAEFAASRQWYAALERLWPLLDPERLLAELYPDRERIAAATPDWSPSGREALYREDGAAWTVADAALLDEAAEFLGPTRSEPVAEETGSEYASEVLAILDEGYEDPDEESLRASDVIDPAMLEQRQSATDTRTVAERAMADREWTYGHIVVDEAQELSPMQWRVLHRRCPVRSMTIAGDQVQSGGSHGWEPALAGRKARVRTLGTNYRVPRQIMEFAAKAVPDEPVPESYREGEPPWISHETDPSALPELVRAELETVAPGTLAVITSDPARIPERSANVLTPDSARGLEFDAVIVVDPQRFEEPNQRYVAFTRPTKRLGVVYTAG